MRYDLSVRAAIYIRLSEETETTTSPARQRQICEAYADSRGWTIVGEPYEDIDVSATKTGLDRPALSRLRYAVQSGDVAVVVVWRLDRLARSVLDTLTLLKEFTDAGCATASATEPIDLTTPIGKAMVALIAIFAEMEADAIKQRVRGSIDALRRGRRFAGGTVPYGYIPAPNPDGPGRILVVDPDEAAVIRETAEMVRDGSSLGAICRRLNERQIPAPRSEFRRLAREGKDTTAADRATWRTQSLRRLLTSDHLAGRVTHRGQLMRDENGLPVSVWEPILDGALLAHLRTVLEPDGQPRERTVRTARILSGLAHCAVCGSKLYVSTSGGRPVYHCPSRRNGVVCPSPRVSAEALERYVVTETLKAIGERPIMRTVPMNAPQVPWEGYSLPDVKRAMDEVAAELTQDGADIPALLGRLQSLKEVRAEIVERDTNQPILNVLEDTGATWAEEFAIGDTDRQRILLEDEINEVRVAPTTSRSRHLDTNRIEIVWEPEE